MRLIILIFLMPLFAWADPALKIAKEQFTTEESVIIEFSELPGNKKDWIVISLPTATPFKPGDKRQFTDGQINGTLDFGKLDVGKYEARLYFNYPTGGYKIQAKVPFEVTGMPLSEAASTTKEITLTTDKEQYLINEPVTISFTGVPGDQKDYISVPRPDAHPTYQPQMWKYLEGKKSGSITFESVISGEWEARLYFKTTGYKIQKTVRFHVKNPDSKISTEKNSYTTEEPIKVIFSALPGFKRDWLSVIIADKGDDAFDKTGDYTWETNGIKEGEKEFPPIKDPGTYQVRAYYDYPTGGYEVKARAEFTVVDPNDKDDEDEEKKEDGEKKADDDKKETTSEEKPAETTDNKEETDKKTEEASSEEKPIETTEKKDDVKPEEKASEEKPTEEKPETPKSEEKPKKSSKKTDDKKNNVKKEDKVTKEKEPSKKPESNELGKKEVKKLDSLSSINESSPSSIKEKNFFEKFEKLEQEHRDKAKESAPIIDEPIQEETTELKNDSQKSGKIILPDILLPDLPQWK